MTKIKKLDGDTKVTTADLAPGRYRLSAAFKVSTPDRRLASGLYSTNGWKAGVMVWARLSRAERVRDGFLQAHVSGLSVAGVPQMLELSAPWASGSSSFATGFAGDEGTRVWYPRGMTSEDWEAFISLLVPDEGDEAWLDETCSEGRYSNGSSYAVLLELLTTGVVTRAQIETAHAAYEARLNAEDP